jgi:hypothetical protein
MKSIKIFLSLISEETKLLSKNQNIYYPKIITYIILCTTIVASSIMSNCNRRQIKHFEKWTFVYVADIQVGSPRSFRFQPAWNENWETTRKRIIDIDPEFLLIGGDLTRDGSIHKWELENIKADLDSLPFPYHVIPGNMDTGNKHTDVTGARKDRNDVALNITSEHVEQFKSVFGEIWWSFVHKNLRVYGFCDMLLGSGLPQEKELARWLGKQRNQPKTTFNIWMMHYALFVDSLKEQNWDITNPEEYLAWYFGINEPHRSNLLKIFKETQADRVITGHIHCRKNFFVNGIHFDLAPATCFSQWQDKWKDGDATLGFFKYDVSEDKIEKSFIPLTKVSTKKGYGPGGHPSPEQRDYSKAWEKN